MVDDDGASLHASGAFYAGMLNETLRWVDDMAKGKTTATVNGVIHETVVDKYGVQRFRANAIIRDLVDAALDGKRLDQNEIAVRVHHGQYTLDDKRELYRLIGYSVCGYCEVFTEDEVSS